ncbi:MAG: hypothetical protein JWL69_2610, partial [Phycisphaerales bacterium]|nr:hypothetical protein [Phycisphaerales bacterium]
MTLRNHISSMRIGLLAGGMVAAGLAMSAPAFASEVDLTLVLGTSGTTKTWKAYATIANDPNSGGLDDLLFDVKTTGSILLGSATAVNQGTKLPGSSAATPLLFTASDSSFQVKAGFFQLVQNNNISGAGPSSYTDVQLGGGQDVQYHKDPDPTITNDNLAHFFGTPGVTSGQVGDTSVSYGSNGANAALVGQGTYTGTSGTIAITGDAKNFAILNTQFFFTDSLGNSNVAAHGVDTVQG